jgi:hypothetical protein
LGGSKVIIEWLNNRGRLQAIAIEGWKFRTKDLINFFQEINFHHIFREFNKEADQLSKQAIYEPEGRISYFKWENGAAGPLTHLNLFLYFPIVDFLTGLLLFLDSFSYEMDTSLSR